MRFQSRFLAPATCLGLAALALSAGGTALRAQNAPAPIVAKAAKLFGASKDAVVAAFGIPQVFPGQYAYGDAGQNERFFFTGNRVSMVDVSDGGPPYLGSLGLALNAIDAWTNVRLNSMYYNASNPMLYEQDQYVYSVTGRTMSGLYYRIYCTPVGYPTTSLGAPVLFTQRFDTRTDTTRWVLQPNLSYMSSYTGCYRVTLARTASEMPTDQDVIFGGPPRHVIDIPLPPTRNVKLPRL